MVSWRILYHIPDLSSTTATPPLGSDPRHPFAKALVVVRLLFTRDKTTSVRQQDFARTGAIDASRRKSHQGDCHRNHPFLLAHFNLYSSVENHAETQRTQRREERTMTLTSHGNLNLKGFIHHYGDCRKLSVVLVSSEISAFSAFSA